MSYWLRVLAIATMLFTIQNYAAGADEISDFWKKINATKSGQEIYDNLEGLSDFLRQQSASRVGTDGHKILIFPKDNAQIMREIDNAASIGRFSGIDKDLQKFPLLSRRYCAMRTSYWYEASVYYLNAERKKYADQKKYLSKLACDIRERVIDMTVSAEGCLRFFSKTTSMKVSENEIKTAIEHEKKGWAECGLEVDNVQHEASRRYDLSIQVETATELSFFNSYRSECIDGTKARQVLDDEAKGKIVAEPVDVCLGLLRFSSKIEPSQAKNEKDILGVFREIASSKDISLKDDDAVIAFVSWIEELAKGKYSEKFKGSDEIYSGKPINISQSVAIEAAFTIAVTDFYRYGKATDPRYDLKDVRLPANACYYNYKEVSIGMCVEIGKQLANIVLKDMLSGQD